MCSEQGGCGHVELNAFSREAVLQYTTAAIRELSLTKSSYVQKRFAHTPKARFTQNEIRSNFTALMQCGSQEKTY